MEKLKWIKEIKDESYLNEGGLFFMKVAGSLVGAAMLSTGVLIVILVVGLPLSFLLSWLKLYTFSDKIVQLIFLLPIMSFPVFCIIVGATEGVRGYKEHLN